MYYITYTDKSRWIDRRFTNLQYDSTHMLRDRTKEERGEKLYCTFLVRPKYKLSQNINKRVLRFYELHNFQNNLAHFSHEPRIPGIILLWFIIISLVNDTTRK